MVVPFLTLAPTVTNGFAKPFVTVGAKVKKGTTILIIEAMKTMNHIQATSDGELKEVCVKDGEAIEFDQILAKIK